MYRMWRSLFGREGPRCRSRGDEANGRARRETMNEISIVALGLAFGVGTLIGMTVVYFSSGRDKSESELREELDQARGIIQGLQDVADGRTKPFAQIKEELRDAELRQTNEQL